MLKVREARETDPASVQAFMTDKDREELHCEFGWTARAEMGLCLAKSAKAWTVLEEGKPAMIFGVWPSETEPSYGRVWSIGASRIFTDHIREFALGYYVYLPELSKNFKYLGAVVSTKKRHIERWLRFLGFSKTADYPEDRQAEYMMNLTKEIS